MNLNYSHEDDVVEGQPIISSVVVLSTPTPLPATPTAGRNVLLIRNPSMVDVALCNGDGSGSYTLEAGDTIKFITKSADPLFYAKQVNSQAVTVEIMEWR